MEKGHQNHQRISSNNNNSATGSAINAIQSFNRFRGSNARGNQSGRVTVNPAAIGQCRGFGHVWTTTNRHVCPALDNKCNHCGLLNHFAKVSSRQDNRIDNVETAESTE